MRELLFLFLQAGHTYQNGEIQWSSSPNTHYTKLSAKRILETVPGPTTMAVSRVTEIQSAFELVIPDLVQQNQSGND